MKNFYTLSALLLMLVFTVNAQQGIPGYFQVTVTDLPGAGTNQAVVKMRAVSTIIPQVSTCDANDQFATDIVAGLKFAIKWPTSSGITSIARSTSNNLQGECPDPGADPLAGYGMVNGSIVLTSNDGLTKVRSFLANTTPTPIPVNWALNQWMTICTLTITGGNCSTCEALDVYMIGDVPELEGGTDLDHIFAFDENGVGIALEYDASPFNGPLPLNLIAFDAEKSGTRDAYLTWTTANEENTSHFQIQRSFDKKNWYDAGNVGAAGYSVDVRNYSFFDYQVYNGLDSRLNVYYRLKMVDRDGKLTLSPTKSVIFGSDGTSGREFLVYPNPASEGVHVEWTSTDIDNPTSLEFYDLAGKLIYTQQVPENSNEEYVDFTKTAIHSGLFIMRVMSGDLPLEYKQIVVDKR